MRTLLLFLAAYFTYPAIALANGRDDGHMGGWGGMMNFWFGGIFMWVLILVVIVLAVYLISRSARPNRYRESAMETSKETPIDILKKRYAKGEIGREEFERMRKELTS